MSSFSSSDSATVEDVRHAYRLLLGREPDPHGYATYERLLSERPVHPRELAQLFMSSEEFQALNGTLSMIKVPRDGYQLFVNPSDHDVSGCLLRGQAYEPYVEAALRAVLRPGDTFVDVGANIGYFTALAAHLVGPHGHVAAWEPLDKNVQLIHATLWENRFRHVTVYPFAASNEVGLVAMSSGPLTSNAGIVRTGFGERRTRVIAQSQRLDDLLGRLERVDVIKFDIEGHELFAWQGAAALLARHRPHVLTEFHPKCIRDNTNHAPEEYLSALLAYSGQVEVLHRTRARVACTDVASIMREWQRADDEFGMHGGMHIDLYVKPPRG